MAQWNPKANEIFLNALDLAAPERHVYLDSACAGDSALRSAVENLLQAHESAGSLLERPAPAAELTMDQVTAASPGRAADRPGTRIGPYKLLEQIGEGGMGVVFMAEQQEPVRRLVALKVIKPGMDSTQVLVRFEAERQALALMDHPNIAKVFDAGATSDGRPYFVMELVKGTPITKFCDERKLPTRRRLELFVAVCHAIQHAHQKGIIHRDIKPSNVLVALYDDKPVVKAIDFGVAKAAGQALTERTLHTGFGTIVGTPEYMSPEQATFNQLDIDTRSDVYALGVLLYELLTGATPLDKTRFKEAAVLEMLRVVREEEPPRPSVKLSTDQTRASIAAARGDEPDKLARELKGELDWIVMKSLEKERNRRYDTAAALGRDVERYLKDEVIEARAPNLGYRLRKTIRKHRGPVLAAALVLLALVGGVIGTTVGMVQAIFAGRAAQRARDEADTNKQIADGLKDRAIQDAAEAVRLKNLADENAKAAKFQALRADTARHDTQMNTILRAWQRDDLHTANEVLDEIPDTFRGTLEYRFLRELCRRRTRPLMVARPLEGLKRERPLLFSLDSKELLLDNFGELLILDAATGKKLRSVRVKAPDFKGSPYQLKARISADSRWLAYLDLSRKPCLFRVFDTASGEPLFQVEQQSSWDRLINADFSPDSTRCAVVGADQKTIQIWNLGSKKFEASMPNAETIRALAYGPDNQVAVLSDAGVVVWNAGTGKKLAAVGEKSQAGGWYDVVFFPDGQRLLTFTMAKLGFLPVLKVWDIATGKELSQLRFEGSFRDVSPLLGYHTFSLVLSQDGTRLISGNRIWDVATGQIVLILPEDVQVLALAPDGRRFVAHYGDRADANLGIFEAP